MNNDRSRKALLRFLDYVAEKGLMAKNTVAARKAAANSVLGVLSEDEAEDVLGLDLKDVMRRFQNLEGQRYTPGSLNTYQSRVRAALQDFEAYLNNPMAFRPSVQARDRTSRGGNPSTAPDSKTSTGSAAPRFASPPGASSIVPIPIRADLTVYVQGLPYDLTITEGRKIANVILAMAVPGE